MKSNKRCSVCDKKIPQLYIQMYTCRCKSLFCEKHMLKHDCTVNYKELFKRENKMNINNIENINKNKLEYI